MNKEIISTSDLNTEIININNLIDNLDNIIDKINKKIENLSTDNNTYYSKTSIKIYDNNLENQNKIKELHNKLKNFINQTPIIIEEYENLENKIINQIDNIPSIKINE